ncbi:reverse transcriptase-like protein [Neobacillus niacini]|uniref:reverse transcriptase-like protein n=1 Tax=Neobacillus niacini TaxID=86668 RepID=UPI0030033B30
MSIIVTTKQRQKPNSTTVLLLRDEMIKSLRVSKAQMAEYLKDGMPHYLIGQEYRFLETEVLKWLETYKPSQERLEREFRDKHGRTIKDYVTGEIVLATLRISQVNLKSLRKKGMPFVTVGEKDFFHIQDILNYFRKGDPIVTNTKESDKDKNEQSKKTKATQPSVKSNVVPIKPKKVDFVVNLSANISHKIPLFIVDGSYNFENNSVGTGMLLIEKREKVTGFSNVRTIKTAKTNICEYLAVLDALRMINIKNIEKAIIITDQELFAKGIQIDLNKTIYEPVIKPYMKEIKELVEKLEGKVDLQYVGILRDGKKNLLHKKAHSLSRGYKKEVFENMEIDHGGK